MTVRSIAVLGAGHGGCAAAADLTNRGFSVRLHARNPDRLAPLKAHGGIEARGVAEGVFSPQLMTTDVAEAVRDADLIMLVVPSAAHAYYAHHLAPLLDGSRPIFVNPGHTGGGLHLLHELRQAGYCESALLCETITLTYVTRMEGPALVGIYNYNKRLRFAALPAKHTAELLALVRPLYPEIEPASSVLETALSNMNAVFHPPGMIMNAGWIQHTGGNFLFYKEGITDAVGRVTAAIDAERLTVAKALGVSAAPFLDVFCAAGLTTAAARDSGDISRACKESEPNKSIGSPPSLDHRYVHEDIGFGLVAFSEFGRVAGVQTPTIDAMIQLASQAVGIDYRREGLTLERLGLEGKIPSELLRFVLEGE